MEPLRSKLLRTISAARYRRAVRMLDRLRKRHPGYPDHELILYALCRKV